MLMSGEGLECGRSGDIHRTKRFLDDGEREDVKEALAQKNLLGWADLGEGGKENGLGEWALGTGQWPTGQACEELLASRLLWRSLGLAGCEGKWPLLLVLSGWPCLQRDSVLDCWLLGLPALGISPCTVRYRVVRSTPAGRH